MKPLAMVAAAALLAAAGSASAQTQPPMYRIYAPSWMQDDGSSSDYPMHTRSDFTADRLNHRYRNGLAVPPARRPATCRRRTSLRPA